MNPAGRFERLSYAAEPGEEGVDGVGGAAPTTWYPDLSERVLTRNDSPDIGFTVSLNPYRGCEHGCAYCYARPTHHFLGYSAGLDFERILFAKVNAPRLLAEELSSPGWEPQVVAMSGVTDPYQPLERDLRITRECLRVFAEFRNPVGIVTKSRLVVRDLDLLGELAGHGAAWVHVSVTTLDAALAAVLEPRAPTPAARLEAIRELARGGVPVGVMVAPVIPGLNDHEIAGILEAAAEAGARRAGFVLLRLPYDVADLFREWVRRHRPGLEDRIFERVRDTRGGRLNVSAWGERMRGSGPYAEQLGALFRVTVKRLGLDAPVAPLSVRSFRRPGPVQMELCLSG